MCTISRRQSDTKKRPPSAFTTPRQRTLLLAASQRQEGLVAEAALVVEHLDRGVGHLHKGPVLGVVHGPVKPKEAALWQAARAVTRNLVGVSRDGEQPSQAPWATRRRRVLRGDRRWVDARVPGPAEHVAVAEAVRRDARRVGERPRHRPVRHTVGAEGKARRLATRALARDVAKLQRAPPPAAVARRGVVRVGVVRKQVADEYSGAHNVGSARRCSQVAVRASLVDEAVPVGPFGRDRLEVDIKRDGANGRRERRGDGVTVPRGAAGG
mmetsp:Transcript_67920/g.180700  ORF Transcript_67920/g.180700 Transcript_67920/m.180700 type:complete len:269 (-) Transcript_67920:598-1404(-)